MGYRLLQFAVTGKDPTAIYDELGVAPTSQFEEIAESPIVGAVLSNGSYLLCIDDNAAIPADDAFFARMSRGARLLACHVNETCMCSEATFWFDGQKVWAVYHDSQNGIEHLEVEGDTPPEFPAIRDRLLAEQRGIEDTDFVFDIPIELVKELGGFRYDEDIPGAGPKPFQVLRQTAVAPVLAARERRPWWRFWR